jgi:Predicted endonuclease containing a URI domain
MNTIERYYYVYVLRSEKDRMFYTGYTADVENRLRQHNAGQVESTASRRPLVLIYWEACLNQQDATRREKYLKTTWGKRYLKSRLKNYLTSSPRETIALELE